jgi:hypothetical protein
MLHSRHRSRKYCTYEEENPGSMSRKKVKRGKSRVHIEKENIKRKIQGPYQCREKNPGSIHRKKV